MAAQRAGRQGERRADGAKAGVAARGAKWRGRGGGAALGDAAEGPGRHRGDQIGAIGAGLRCGCWVGVRSRVDATERAEWRREGQGSCASRGSAARRPGPQRESQDTSASTGSAEQEPGRQCEHGVDGAEPRPQRENQDSSASTDGAKAEVAELGPEQQYEHGVSRAKTKADAQEPAQRCKHRAGGARAKAAVQAQGRRSKSQGGARGLAGGGGCGLCGGFCGGEQLWWSRWRGDACGWVGREWLWLGQGELSQAAVVRWRDRPAAANSSLVVRRTPSSRRAWEMGVMGGGGASSSSW
ncbi:hypothetical protein CLV68_6487 [Actinokineospora cianjurensis]|uniref:Uncharacterized protein n=1 Tax=Actinokineospora cianjurensis TaxID=585224 RepID=A0A421AV96_9PSEU|nr:hypothetical protein CLV68_6487 [Actinokineospora cianjurensis]